MGLTEKIGVGVGLRLGLSIFAVVGFFFFEFFGKWIGFGLFKDLMVKLLEVGITDHLLLILISL